jgi:hypothetical protein
MNQANPSLFFASPQRNGANPALFYQLVKIRSAATFNGLAIFGWAHPLGIVPDLRCGKNIIGHCCVHSNLALLSNCNGASDDRMAQKVGSIKAK